MEKSCPCGSNKPRRPLLDSRGVFYSYICDDCEEEKRNKYRQEIFDKVMDQITKAFTPIEE